MFPWRKEGSEEILKHLQCLKVLKREGEGILSKAWGDRTRGKGFKLNEKIFR